MIRHRILRAAVALSMAFGLSPATASPAASETRALPTGVQAVVQSYGHQCADLGGTLRGEQRPALMSADLDGDTKPDFVINPQRLQCSASATLFCSNGGCQIGIALSGNDYAEPVSALGGQPTLVQAEDGTRLEIWVSRQNCGDAPRTSACWASYSWPDGKQTLVYASRPNAP